MRRENTGGHPNCIVRPDGSKVRIPDPISIHDTIERATDKLSPDRVASIIKEANFNSKKEPTPRAGYVKVITGEEFTFYTGKAGRPKKQGFYYIPEDLAKELCDEGPLTFNERFQVYEEF